MDLSAKASPPTGTVACYQPFRYRCKPNRLDDFWCVGGELPLGPAVLVSTTALAAHPPRADVTGVSTCDVITATMAVDSSGPEAAARTAPLALDPSTLTHAYRRQTAAQVSDAAAGRRCMPPITRSNMAARRDLQRLIRAEAECGRQRPPTPARPSLPQLEASSRGRAGSPTGRGSRSRSEPRASGPQEDSDDSDQVRRATGRLRRLRPGETDHRRTPTR